MVVRLTQEQARFLRLKAQRLRPAKEPPLSKAAQVVKVLCGVQAQEPPAARLAIRARSKGLVAADVENARVGERTIVRTWCMRGTLHLVTADDLGWLLSLLGPLFVRKSRRRYAELGLTEEICIRSSRAIRGTLSDESPLTRAELAERLSAHGIPTEGQAIYHLLRRAGLEGLICYGPDRDGEPTYVLLAEWADTGHAIADDDARAELSRRYLAGYGPAGPEDFAVWSGLRLREARAAFKRIAGDLLELDLFGSLTWLLKDRAKWLEEFKIDEENVQLLPGYDPYLLGYRGRDLAVPKEYAKRVHPGGGLLRPTLLVNGLAEATWKMARTGGRLTVMVQPFQDLAPETILALEYEVRDLGRFLEAEAELNLLAPSR